MIYRPYGLIAVFWCLAVSLAAADFSIVTVHHQRLEQTLASSALEPELLLSLPFGKAPAQVAGAAEDEKRLTDGVPYAFRVAADSSIWLLDSANGALKRFSPVGTLLGSVPLPGVSSHTMPIYKDFAFGPQQNLYLYCSTDKKVYLVKPSGEIIVEIEGLGDTQRIESDPQGNLVVENPVLGGVLRFSPAGTLIEKTAPGLAGTAFTDSQGRLYILERGETTGTLQRLIDIKANTRETLATFSLELPPERQVVIAGLKLIGTDASGNCYILLFGTDSDGVLHAQRVYTIAPDGTLMNRRNILTIPFLSPDLPRHFAIAPDGRLIAFSANETHYRLLKYSLK
jgi:hypothetical protein